MKIIPVKSFAAALMALCALCVACDERSADPDDDLGPVVTVEFDITEDAMIQSAVPDVGYGTANLVRVAYVDIVGGPLSITRTLIGLPPLPDSVAADRITRAVLRLRVTEDRDWYFAITAHRVVQPWIEDSVTWRLAPQFDPADMSLGVLIEGWVYFDVLDAYTDPLSYGVMLTTTGPEQDFCSSEDPFPSRRPRLSVSYHENY